MSRRAFRPALLLAAVMGMALAIPSAAQIMPRKKKPAVQRTFLQRFSLEAMGGWALAGLADLNLFSDYYAGFDDYYYRLQFERAAARQGSWFTYSTVDGIEGEYPRLRNLFPAGARLAYEVDDRWSLFLGLSYISGRSSVPGSAVVDGRNLNPDTVEMVNIYRLEIEYPVHRLAVRAWAPTLGARFRFPISKKVDLSAYVAAGWMWARFAWDCERTQTTTDEKSHWSRSVYGGSASGRGAGLIVETGGRLRVGLSNRLDAFLEAGWAYRRASGAKGDFTYRSGHADDNSTPYETTSVYRDIEYWVKDYHINNTWGSWTYSNVYVGVYTPPSRPFLLDLSGLEMKVGLAWRL
ncbi:MAG: hypothetical protein NTZ26_05300 [Candidatus Aminicenantes bacterium]|nr:hypothetical protein [Candidatus Aminicenantes bacterium]